MIFIMKQQLTKQSGRLLNHETMIPAMPVPIEFPVNFEVISIFLVGFHRNEILKLKQADYNCVRCP